MKQIIGTKEWAVKNVNILHGCSNVLKMFEPNAPVFEERLESLVHAHEQQFETSVSVEPMLDLEPHVIYEKTERFITDSIWFGMINRVNSIILINEPGNRKDSIKSLIGLKTPDQKGLDI